MNALPPLVFIRLVVCRSGVFDSAADLDSGDVERHWVFIVTGGIGIIWSLIWFRFISRRA